MHLPNIILVVNSYCHAYSTFGKLGVQVPILLRLKLQSPYTANSVLTL